MTVPLCVRNVVIAIRPQGIAGKRDQSMLLAQILLGVGFAVFLGYTAIVNFMRI